MDMAVDPEKYKLPYYLLDDKAGALREALKQFPKIFNYSKPGDQSEILQGDLWCGFESVSFSSLSKREMSGVVVSNTCDVCVDNKRHLPANISFAPIMSLAKFVQLHVDEAVDEKVIQGKITSLKNQEVSDLFFLPSGQYLEEECVVMFGHIQSMPLNVFLAKETKKKQFSLSNIGFYLLLSKLSFHFCRFHEEIDRG